MLGCPLSGLTQHPEHGASGVLLLRLLPLTSQELRRMLRRWAGEGVGRGLRPAPRAGRAGGCGSGGTSAAQSGGASFFSQKASLKKQRSERSERQQKLLSIVVTTGTIYELGAVVCEWALRGVYEPWW